MFKIGGDEIIFVRTDAAEREHRALAPFAEPQGGQACEAR